MSVDAKNIPQLQKQRSCRFLNDIVYTKMSKYQGNEEIKEKHGYASVVTSNNRVADTDNLTESLH